MVLERVLDSQTPSECPAHAKGRTLHKVTFKVFDVSDVSAQTTNAKSKMWYTITAASYFDSMPLEMGKITSKRIKCGDGQFDSEHEMLIDSNMCQSLVLKLKHKSMILNRKITAGMYTFHMPRDEGENANIDDTVKLKDKQSNVVGSLRICVTVARTASPALHFAPRPLWKPESSVMTRPYCSLQRDESSSNADCHTVSYFQKSHGSIKVQGLTQQVVAKEGPASNTWTIAEKVDPTIRGQMPGRQFELSCGSADAKSDQLLAFDLRQTDGWRNSRSDAALLPGNMFDEPVAGGAQWGVWTLVRQKTTECKTEEGEEPETEVEFLALIHIAGPSVECRTAQEAPLALAVAHAMFWACIRHAASYHQVCELVYNLFHAPTKEVTSHGTAESGRGFMVIGSQDALFSSSECNTEQNPAAYTKWMESRMKHAGIGKDLQGEERCVATFLQNSASGCRNEFLLPGALVASQFDWAPGGTVLGIPLF